MVVHSLANRTKQKLIVTTALKVYKLKTLNPFYQKMAQERLPLDGVTINLLLFGSFQNHNEL